MKEQKFCIHCNSPYEVDEKETDDGFCSFDCWEQENCGTRKIRTAETINLD